MVKILQVRLQQYVKWEVPDVQVRFRKGRGPEIKLPILVVSWGKQGHSKRISISAPLTTLKPLTTWITASCGRFLKKWEYQTTLPVSWETYMQDKKHQLELHMEQWIASKLGKVYIKAVYCNPTYLMYMQSTLCEMPGWMTHKLESRLQEEISTTSYMQMIPL